MKTFSSSVAFVFLTQADGKQLLFLHWFPLKFDLRHKFQNNQLFKLFGPPNLNCLSLAVSASPVCVCVWGTNNANRERCVYACTVWVCVCVNVCVCVFVMTPVGSVIFAPNYLQHKSTVGALPWQPAVGRVLVMVAGECQSYFINL